jgi:D-threo-aldose 1-dehydrogenase
MPFRYVFDFTYDAIMRSHELSLQRLGLERIDILLLHDLGRFAQGDNYDQSLRQALEGGIKALQDLKASGQIRAIGAGVNEWQVLDVLMDHAQFDGFLLANRYTLLDQQVLDGFLPRCVKEAVSIIDGAPLNGGILATGATPDARYDYRPATKEMLEKVRGIEAVCQSLGLPLVRAGLNFPLGHNSVVAIIPGFAVPDDLRKNLAHFQAKVPAELWSTLKEKGLLHPDAPAPVTPVLSS